MIFNYGFNEDRVQVLGAYSLLFCYAVITLISILIIAIGSLLQILCNLNPYSCCKIRFLHPTCQIPAWTSSESILVTLEQQLSTAGEK